MNKEKKFLCTRGQWIKVIQCCGGRPRRTDASFVLLTHDRGMEAPCAAERFRRRNTATVHFRPKQLNKERLQNTPVLSGVTATSSGDPSSLWGRTGVAGALAVRRRGQMEVSPSHNVTNPSGRTLLHTLYLLPSFHVLGQMSEDPDLGATTGKDGERVVSTGHSFSLHHFTLEPPVRLRRHSLSLSVFSFSGSRLPLLVLCPQDSYQGLAQTYATCHPVTRPRPRRPEAGRSLNWRSMWHHSSSVLLQLSILHFLRLTFMF